MTDTLIKLRAVIEKSYAEEERYLNLLAKVREVLVKFEGKQINKRLITAIQKAHSDWTVSLYAPAGMTNLRVYGGDSGYLDFNDRATFFLGYNNDLTAYDMAKFDERNSTVHLLKRNGQRKALLADTDRLERLADMIDDFTALKRSIAEVIDELPDHYDIEDLAGLRMG